MLLLNYLNPFVFLLVSCFLSEANKINKELDLKTDNGKLEKKIKKQMKKAIAQQQRQEKILLEVLPFLNFIFYYSFFFLVINVFFVICECFFPEFTIFVKLMLDGYKTAVKQIASYIIWSRSSDFRILEIWNIIRSVFLRIARGG